MVIVMVMMIIMTIVMMITMMTVMTMTTRMMMVLMMRKHLSMAKTGTTDSRANTCKVTFPPPRVERYRAESPAPPTVVDIDAKGDVTYRPLSTLNSLQQSSSPCPETHFQCADHGYCLPVFLR